MTRQLRRALTFAGVALLLAATAALAAGPKKGATYTGTLSHGKELISLKVSANGKAVTVNAPFSPLYCEGGGGGTVQLTKPATIAKNGKFKGVITYEFTPLHSKVTKLYFSGRFTGKTVKGTARSEYGLLNAQARKNLEKCDGSTSFVAKAK